MHGPAGTAIKAGQAGDRLRRPPPAVLLIHHEVMGDTWRGVEPAGTAVARRGARHRFNSGQPTPRCGPLAADHRLGDSPGAVPVIDDQRHLVAGTVIKEPPALQLPADAHDTEVIQAGLTAAEPETGPAAPHPPAQPSDAARTPGPLALAPVAGIKHSTAATGTTTLAKRGRIAPLPAELP